MSDLDALNASLFGPGGTLPLIQQKQVEVATAGQQKLAQIGKPVGGMPSASDLMALSSAQVQHNGRPIPATDPYQKDLVELTPDQLREKYGPEVAGQLINAQLSARAQYSALANAGARSPAGAVTDTAAGIGLGAFNGVAGIAALGFGGLGALGVLPKGAGARAAQLISQADDWAQRHLETPELNLSREKVQLDTQANVAQNRIQATEAENRGDDALLTELGRIGANTLDSATETLKSGRVTADGAAGMGGGLLVGGALGKAAGVLGEGVVGAAAKSSPLAARLISAAAKTPAGEYLAEHAPIVAGNAAMMGGGAYQDTAAGIMNLDPSQLAQTSPEFRARVAAGEDPAEVQADLANRAGLIAGGLQTPWALATGGVAAKFRANPLAVQDLGTAAADIGKSTAEGVLQQTGGQFFQNLGVQQSGVNPDQDLSEGLGEQAGQATLYGLGAGLGLQAPSLALGGAKLAGKGVVEAGKSALSPVLARGDRLLSDLVKASPVSLDKVQAGLNAAAPTVDAFKTRVAAWEQSDEGKAHRYDRLVSKGVDPETARSQIYGEAENPTSGGQSQAGPSFEDHVKQYLGAIQQDPAEAEQQSSPAVAEALKSAGDNRLVAMARVADIARDTNADPQDRIAAGFYLKDALEKNKAAIETAIPGMLGHIPPEDHEAVGQLQSIGTTLRDMTNHFAKDPEIQKAISGSLDLAEKTQPKTLSAKDLTTPEGKLAADNVVKLAEHAPEKVDPNLAQLLLKHAEQGKFALTDQQKAILQAAVSFAHEHRAELDQARELGLKTMALVSHEVRAADKDAQARGPSAKAHMQGIVRAVKSGDLALAKDRLERFMAFAQHMNNKVDSLNASLAVGGTNEANRVPFHAYNGTTGEWYQAHQWFNPRAENSVKRAQMVALDAHAVTQLANSMADAFPQLKVAKVVESKLSDERVLSGKAADVSRAFAQDKSFKAVPVQDHPTAGAPYEPSSAPPEQAIRAEQPAQSNSTTDSTPVELNSEPVQSEKVEALEGVATSETVQADSQKDPEQIPSAEPAPAEKTAIQKAYPNLVGSKALGGGNWFTKAFSLPEQAKSRLVGLGRPVAEAIQVLTDHGKFRAWVGDKDVVARRLTGEAADAYRAYLPLAQVLGKTLTDRLALRLKANYYGTTIEGSLNGEEAGLKKDGTPAPSADRLRYGRVLNLTEPKDGSFVYNSELLGGALLSGLHWALNQAGSERVMDDDDIHDELGIPYQDITQNTRDVLNLGRSLDEATQGLAATITRFWGVNADPDVAEGLTKGIPAGMALEVLEALNEHGLIRIHEDTKIGGKTFIRVESLLGREDLTDAKGRPVKPTVSADTLAGLKQFPSALEHFALHQPEEVRYIDEPPTEVAETQLRNPGVKLTEQQKTVLRAAQNTARFLNQMTVDFARNLDERGLLRLFGRGDPDGVDKAWNANHKASVRGYNQTILGAFAALKDLQFELGNKAAAAGVADHEMPIYSRWNFNRVNRLQMDGAYNEQSSKLMREWLLPTRSQLDLTKPEDLGKLMLAMAQAWGVKIHNDGVESSIKQASDLANGKLKPAIELLQRHLKYPDALLRDEDIDVLRNTFGIDAAGNSKITPVALHAALEYARYANAHEAKDLATLKAYDTQMYVEADGVTDGVVNALVHYSTGPFTAAQVRAFKRGGFFFTRNSLASYRKLDGADLYQATLTGFRSLLDRMRAAYPKVGKGSGVMRNQDALLRVMSVLLPDVGFDPNSGVLTRLDRGVVKNPMTISVYGSGADGIAGNLVAEMADELYRLHSDNPKQAIALYQDLRQLSEWVAGTKLDGKVYVYKAEKVNLDTGRNLQDFTLTKDMIDNLTANVRHLFVNQMRAAVSEQMGHINDPHTGTMTKVRQAVQVMGIFQHYAFMKAYKDLIAEKKANDPTWKEGDGLSQTEKNQLLRQTMPLGPLVETGTQNIYPAGAASSNLHTDKLASDLFENLKPNDYLYGPVDPGVRGIAFMNIAPGDGQMIQNILTIPGGPQGGLPVYDGFHMKLSTLWSDAAKINEAVRQGWTANPLEPLSRSYQEFMGRASFDDLSDEHWEALRKAMFGKFNADKYSNESAKNAIKQLMVDLAQRSQDAGVRHEVYAEARTWTDHMAGAEMPHEAPGVDVSGGKAVTQKMLDQAAKRAEPKGETAQAQAREWRLVADDARIAQGLSDLYAQKKAALAQQAQADREAQAPASVRAGAAWAQSGAEWAGQVKANTLEHLTRIGVTDQASGVRVVNVSGVKRLAQSLKLPEAHRPLVQELTQALAKSGYRLVLGTPEQIQAWARINDKQLLGSNQADGETVHGYTVPGDKLIYLNSSAKAETLVHELIHAATLEKVYAYYSNPKSLSTEHQAAIKRLEILKEEWKGLDQSKLTSAEAREAYNNALSTILGHENSTETSSAVAKAAALNEFMAWNLANQHLMDAAKDTQVKSDWRKWGQRILQAVKQLVWTRPEAAPRSLYEALRFDTSVLLGSDLPPSVKAQLDQTALFHSTQYGTDAHLDEVSQKYSGLIASVARDQPDAVAAEQVHERLLHETARAATEVVRHFQAAGFRVTPQQADVMQALVGAFVAGVQLDPAALTRLHEMHIHALRELDPAHFMADPHSLDPNQEAAAQDKLQAVHGEALTLKDGDGQLIYKGAKGDSLLLPAFLALAVANPEMKAALAQIETPKTERDQGKTLDAWANNFGMAMMDKLSATLTGEGQGQPDLAAAIDLLTNRAADGAQSKRDYIASNTNVVSRTISDVQDKVVDLAQVFTGELDDRLASAESRASSPAIRGLIQAGRAFVAIANEERAAHAADGVTAAMHRAGVPEAFGSFVNDLIGRTQSNAGVYDMIKEVRTFVARVRQQFREHLPQLFASRFEQGLSDVDSTVLFKGLGRIDFALVRSSLGLEPAMELLRNPNLALDHIARHEATIRQLAPHGDAEKILQKTAQLARWMTTGEWGHNPLMNAHAIAELFGERGRHQTGVRPSEQLISAIDHLATFYALHGLDPATKERLSNLAQHEAKGVGFMLDYLSGQRKDEQAKLTTDMARYAHYKGYIPSENQEGLNLVVADDRDYQKLVGRGYRRVADYQGSRAELAKPKRGYYFSDLGQSVFDQGVLQNVRQTASGVDPVRGYSYGHVKTAGRITDRDAVKQIQEAHSRLSQFADVGGSVAEREPLRAIYDPKTGKPVAYERMLDPAQEIRLNRSTDLAKMIGVWRGRQAEEAMAGSFNQRLIDALHDIWQRDGVKANQPDKFIDLTQTDQLDAVTRDAVSLFTPETLAYVQRKFGSDGFMVRRDLLQDAIGYRQASVRDAWTGTTRWSPEQVEGFKRIATGIFGVEAYRTMVQAERLLQKAVGAAKDNIVVKSVVVPVTNVLANLYQLTARGVPLKAMISGSAAKTAEIHGYVQRSLRAIDLEAELRASSDDIIRSRKIRAELQAIQDTDRRMSIWPLIQAGEFSTIAEDLQGHDEPLFSGKLKEHFDSLVDGMPEALKTAGRYALVTHDTALYRGLEKSVAYGDFVAKAILYDDLVKRRNLDPQAALAKVAEEFVNYDRLSGRFRSYMERMGLLWFWNYKLRATKTAVSMLRHNPLQALMTGLVPTPPIVGELGLPIQDNFLSVLADGRLGHSIGPGMGLWGFSLNPWVNLFNTVH